MEIFLALLGVVALWVLWWLFRLVTVMTVHRQPDGDDVCLPVQITRLDLLKLCTWDHGLAENWTLPGSAASATSPCPPALRRSEASGARVVPLRRTPERHPGVFL
jgi:hypothetical protein